MSVRSTKAAEGDDPLLDRFSDTLWLEDGLSPATLDSYRRDLRQYRDWLRAAAGKDLLAAEHKDVHEYLVYVDKKRRQVRADKRAKTTNSDARYLSSLRRFYQFALREGKIDTDPTLN